MVQRYGPVALDPAPCGCHVHDGVPDRELAVQVCNRLRVWLPVIQALTANSPFYPGANTGHASWRSAGAGGPGERTSGIQRCCSAAHPGRWRAGYLPFGV